MGLKLKIVNLSTNEVPAYKTRGSVGMDLCANLPEEKTVYLQPGEIKLIPTGIHVELPEGYEAQIRPRSGLAVKQGITVINSPGTIDSDYRGDVGIPLINHSQEPQKVSHGDRIAQMVINKTEIIEWEKVESLEELEKTDRGDGGFGHTGKS